ncbi:D-glycero-beta-D-manno-heptose 1,7-bisphosphate 7-phosphatase [Aquisalimonas sp.]|uniref:D-glycero-beta-D-manno-heptose 1,7-bisphosphate 7-phosphatase n=1 Tax=Aquisalimonas sp. TaxID=1872621 RepID=UPI0025BD533E|nr:D-glycero-beta-D-manno-heptose 1,7-bisphosphate 7-phosphatase [Aquisalimonas sp.]
MSIRAVILDRDGVINADSPTFIKSLAEWQPIAGSLEAIARMSQAGWRVAVCTNQSGLARGLFSHNELEAIHRRLRADVKSLGGQIDGIFVCPHGPDAGCDCRKPRPGLLHQASRALNFSLHRTPVVGDSLRDLEAAIAVGARPMLVRSGKGNATLAQGVPSTTEVAADLAEVVSRLLQEHQRIKSTSEKRGDD